MTRKLDALVAERVMGFSVYHYDKDVASRCYYMLVDDEFDPVFVGDYYNDACRKTEAEAWNDSPDYSTDIAEAWQVVEKMQKNGDDLMAIDYGKFSTPFAEFEYQVQWRRSKAFAIAPTAPLAICIAALRVVGVDEATINEAMGE